MSRLAIIGGSGFASMPGLTPREERWIKTPYGEPSAPVLTGALDGQELLFLPRHGVGHVIPPHRVNYRANLWALKELGAERVVGLGAVGGITRRFPPGTLAVPDQIIDYTYGREHTIHDGHSLRVVHIDFTQPYCEGLRADLLATARRAGLDVVDGGTYGALQGPRLETAAEVVRLERDGCDLVGMTGMPEASLARELHLCYACCAFVVNWGAGKEKGAVLNDQIEANLTAYAAQVAQLLTALVKGTGGT